jgi:hypothetical protein
MLSSHFPDFVRISFAEPHHIDSAPDPAPTPWKENDEGRLRLISVGYSIVQNSIYFDTAPAPAPTSEVKMMQLLAAPASAPQHWLEQCADTKASKH